MLAGLVTGLAPVGPSLAVATPTPSPAGALTGYARDGFRPHAVPDAALPYHTGAAPRVDPGLHDEYGVRMFAHQGVIHDHPVAQAQWGLANLSTYRTSRDQFFLDRAIAQAQRNLDRKVESRGAWWYPYAFDWLACQGLLATAAPWYSAMAQGQLLSLFVRLHEVTGDQKWRTAADLTFASLTLAPQPGLPWASWVDDGGSLWLEEFPVPRGTAEWGARILNGHIFTIYGVYDYWRLTTDPRAVEIFDGAVTTLRRHVPTSFRVAAWISRYSIRCPNAYADYHGYHIGQLLKVYELTRSPLFARLADLFRADYPAPTVSGTVAFSAGTHVGYRFDSAGAIVAQRTLTLTGSSTANADQRIRVFGRGVHYRISNGGLAGFLVVEEPGARVLRGKVVPHTYAPERRLAFLPGTYTGYRYDTAWTVVASRTFTFDTASSAPFGASAWVNGRLGYQITAGVYAGHWVTATDGLVPT